jgi:hypothetical protein
MAVSGVDLEMESETGQRSDRAHTIEDLGSTVRTLCFTLYALGSHCSCCAGSVQRGVRQGVKL